MKMLALGTVLVGTSVSSRGGSQALGPACRQSYGGNTSAYSRRDLLALTLPVYKSMMVNISAYSMRSLAWLCQYVYGGEYICLFWKTAGLDFARVLVYGDEYICLFQVRNRLL